jgi:hypothetical protein
VPVQCLDPRGFAVKAGNRTMPRTHENPRVCRENQCYPEPYVLLAMQKVVGSNPISRFREGLHLQAFSAFTVRSARPAGYAAILCRGLSCGTEG